MSDPDVVNATRFQTVLKHGVMAGWRWRKAGMPRLVFCHATGFCASAYRRMLGRAAARFDIIAPDLRGHGRTTLPADSAQLRSWNVYADDIAAFLDRLAEESPEPVVLAGHSLGAVSAALAAESRSDIRRLMLIEPVTLPASVAALARTPFWPLVAPRLPLVRGARSRRNQWPDRNMVAEAYRRKRLFVPWAEGVLQDYLEDGLADADDGCRLSCDPAWEAATFAAHAYNFWRAVRARSAPMSVLAADSADTTVLFGARGRFSRMGVDLRLLPGTHLMPMEAPETAAQFLLGAAVLHTE